MTKTALRDGPLVIDGYQDRKFHSIPISIVGFRLGPSKMSVYFENSQPILRVEEMARALSFYVDLLGFENAEWGDEQFTSIARDAAGIYLSQGDQGGGKAWIWIGVDDVQQLYEEYVALGVKIRMAPTNYPWALEMHVEDPDGNVIRFGSEPLS